MSTKMRNLIIGLIMLIACTFLLMRNFSAAAGGQVLAPVNTSQGNISVGTRPIAVAVNPVTNKIYIANQGSATVTVIDGSNNTTAVVAVGSSPLAVAVNPVTNKIYVVNHGSSNVTVIDGINNSTATVAIGSFPIAVAVNPVTNKIYVANGFGSTTVTVIDGSNNATSTLAAGSFPIAVAVNPVTNKIYVANQNSANVTVIDGSNNTTSTVAAGARPWAVAVNSVTNKIYVANRNSSTVTVIDGSNNTTTTLTAAAIPWAIDVNPVTNKIYVTNVELHSSNVTVIDGSNNTTTTVAAGGNPKAVAVNPVTNKIYVANQNSGTVTVIDGSNNTTTTLATGSGPFAVAVNSVTNRIYVANSGSNTVTVIDGSNNSTTTLATGSGPFAVAVNPVTNKIYAVNINGSNVTAITPTAQANPITVAIAPLPNHNTSQNRPTFNFTATSTTPTAPPVRRIYYQVDTTTGTWLAASLQGNTGSGQTPPLNIFGHHIIYAFAVDGGDATSINSGSGSSPIIGQISAYQFLYTLPTEVEVSSNTNPSLAGQSVALLASVTVVLSGSVFDGTVQFKDGGVNIGSPAPVDDGLAVLVTGTLLAGTHRITADYSGSATFVAATTIDTHSHLVIDTVVTWTGSTSNDWNTASNWSPGFAPTSLSNVVIPATGVTNEPSISSASVIINNLTIAAGRTLTIAASRTLTVTGTATNSGTIAGAGSLSLSGPTLANNGPISVASALFGGAAQTVSGTGSFTGNNTFIVLSGASVSLTASFPFVNLYISSGGSLNMSSLAISLSGAGAALQVDGALTTTGSTIIYNGTQLQSTAHGNVSYNNLTIANSAGVSLSANTTVTGELALTDGDLSTGAFTLTMPATATSSGSGVVVGSVKRTGITTGTTLSFGNPFNTIRFDSGTPPSEVTVSLDEHVPTTPAPFPTAIARKYTITPTGGSGYSATLRLHYQDADLNGNSEGASLNLWRYDGTNWHKEGQTAFDTTDNWIEKSGITQFSAWTMNSSVPTAATLESFEATGYDGGVFIQWRTGTEVDNLGFNLYRDEGGKRVLVNQQLVAGSALVVGSGVSLGAGRAYSWWDSAASSEANPSYWIEDIDLNGQSSWHGPFGAKLVGGVPPEKSNAAVLSRIGSLQSSATLPLERRTILSPMTAAQISAQVRLAGKPAVKIFVRKEAFYRVTAAELQGAGLDPRVDPRLLQLYADGQQLPINVTTDEAGLVAAIEFYGRGLDAAYTDARVYWLVAGTQPGLRLQQVKADGYPTGARSFLATVERRDRTVYFSALRNGERENFFGAVIATQPVEQTLTLAHVDASAPGQATLEVALQGVTALPHRVWAYLNGQFAGELLFDSQAQGMGRFQLPHSLLREGDNQVLLVAQAGPGDVSLVNYLRLSYFHSFTADHNALRFTASGNQAVAVGGFSSASIRVLDVTNPDAVQELAGKIEQQKTGYTITVTSPESGERQLLAIADEQAGKVARVAANIPSEWRSAAHAANLLMITSRDFTSSLEPLKTLRAKQGFKVETVNVEDIYDEFSFGNKSPQAVKDLLQYATANWKIKPQYLLLVGDASFDAKNYLGFGDRDLVPTKLIDTALMETATDDWFADFNNDGIAEMAVGRLPVSTAEEAKRMVLKIIGYDQARPQDSVLLVADSNDGFDFEAASQQLSALLPPGIRVEQINRGRVDAATAKAQLLEAIASGEKMINYSGHGSVSLWRGNLLTNEDAAGLRNADHLPVFVMMTCLNGYFQDAALDSLAEALLKAEHGGAVAVWASSGMTDPEAQASMNQQMMRLLFQTSGQQTLGDAMRAAKQAASDSDIRRTWILLGDPTMRLK
jgi:YVTN family beta-propeller protein